MLPGLFASSLGYPRTLAYRDAVIFGFSCTLRLKKTGIEEMIRSTKKYYDLSFQDVFSKSASQLHHE